MNVFYYITYYKIIKWSNDFWLANVLQGCNDLNLEILGNYEIYLRSFLRRHKKIQNFLINCIHCLVPLVLTNTSLKFIFLMNILGHLKRQYMTQYQYLL